MTKPHSITDIAGARFGWSHAQSPARRREPLFPGIQPERDKHVYAFMADQDCRSCGHHVCSCRLTCEICDHVGNRLELYVGHAGASCIDMDACEQREQRQQPAPDAAPKPVAQPAGERVEREGWTRGGMSQCIGGYFGCMHFHGAPGIHVFTGGAYAPDSWHQVATVSCGEPGWTTGKTYPSLLEAQLAVEHQAKSAAPAPAPQRVERFDVGDVVRCVDAAYSDDELCLGTEYKVTRWIGGCNEVCVDLGARSWMTRRFELVRRAGDGLPDGWREKGTYNGAPIYLRDDVCVYQPAASGGAWWDHDAAFEHRQYRTAREAALAADELIAKGARHG